MTRTTVSAISAGSMTPTVSSLNTVGKAPWPKWLLGLAKRWGNTPSYTKKLTLSREGVFDLAADAVEEMLVDGRTELVALRCARLDTIRSAHGLMVSTDEHRSLLHENFAKDAKEGPATCAHAMDMTPVTWDTARRLLVAEVAAKMRLIRSGDALYRETR